ncbi:MAG: hypothetical protein Q7U77_11380 [Sediminibacterium sp.]|uniref:hypothetical protein n=1 Tax=Sediminibacterium sp. TaxID=1917865 RepID=UPI0027259B9F|nr:hypothetical protein [Sediminibacterium sp.]MDO8997219.1 hypothetical protein [Sediminibacterium sp.]
MLTQKNGYGCGLYAVANVLGLKHFVTSERLEESKNGINHGKLSKFLQDIGLSLFIDVLYCDTQKSSIPESWCFLYSENPGSSIPILIQCKFGEKFHLMGALLLNEPGKIKLFDSLKTEPIYCTLSDVNTMYENVVALYSINKLDTSDYIAI